MAKRPGETILRAAASRCSGLTMLTGLFALLASPKPGGSGCGAAGAVDGAGGAGNPCAGGCADVSAASTSGALAAINAPAPTAWNSVRRDGVMAFPQYVLSA